MMYKIATIVNFCSNDYPFLQHCLKSVKPFSSQVILPVCDHFFDGKKEDRSLLNQIYQEHADVSWVEFPFGQSAYGSHSSCYWHDLARLIGAYFLREEIEYVLFLDCDEVFDTGKFIQWLDTGHYRHLDAMSFANYWYFREPTFQAADWEHTTILVKKAHLSGKLIMTPDERKGIFEGICGEKQSHITALDGQPMIHHYSWVRTKEQMLRKVQSWSHNTERNWQALVEEEFSRPFNGTDFVHGYRFVTVEPWISLDLFARPEENRDLPLSHVRRLIQEEVNKIDLAMTFDLDLCL